MAGMSCDTQAPPLVCKKFPVPTAAGRPPTELQLALQPSERQTPEAAPGRDFAGRDNVAGSVNREHIADVGEC